MNRFDLGVSRFSTHPKWEIHAESDELLVGIAGELEVTLLLPDGSQQVTIGPGDLFVVPRNVWHSPKPRGEVSLLSMASYGGTRVSDRDDPRA
jgi:mannose-6-phosphate isomerase-like protein (cupin superfamily)